MFAGAITSHLSIELLFRAVLPTIIFLQRLMQQKGKGKTVTIPSVLAWGI